MYNTVPLEIIYLYLLINKAQKKTIKPLLDFLARNTLENIKIYDSAKKILFEKFNLSEFKYFIEKNKDNSNLLSKYLNKIRKNLDIYILDTIKRKTSTAKMREKIELFCKTIDEYEDINIVIYFKTIALFIHKQIKTNGNILILNALYIYFEEYMDLFIKAREIIHNSSFINQQFEKYFTLINVHPNNLVFINTEKNIKIMQNFLPVKCFDKILDISGCKYDRLKERYFLIELDKSMASPNGANCIPHEVGHLLNLIIFNFQSYLVNQLYLQDTTVNVTILNNWLNEIIADLIGGIISTDKDYPKNLNSITECAENVKYPPTSFRKCLLENEIYDFNKIKNPELKQIAYLIHNNIDLIKNILTIVKS